MPNALDLVDGRPPTVDQMLGQPLNHESRPAVDEVAMFLPSPVEAQVVFQLFELPRIRVDRRLFSSPHGVRPFPVRLLLEPGKEGPCGARFHDVRNKCSCAVSTLSIGSGT